MTVIAWDGRTLAADKRAVAHHIYAITKIARVGEDLVGVSGCGDKIREFQQWLLEGRKPDAYPKRNKEDEYWHAIVIRPTGLLERFEGSPTPILVEGAPHAIGSGAQAAMAAMLCGKSAREAVEIACLVDEGCGNGIDELALQDPAVDRSPLRNEPLFLGFPTLSPNGNGAVASSHANS